LFNIWKWNEGGQIVSLNFKNGKTGVNESIARGGKMTAVKINNLTELSEYIENQESRIASLETEITELKESIKNIIAHHNDIAHFIDDELPDTDLLSRDFLKRAFAVWGHYFIAQLIIGVIFGIGYFLIVITLLNTFRIR
jgi:hypothetical protein